MKIIALIFVGPVVLPIVVIFNHYIFYEKIAVALEDFTYIERYDGLRELDSLNNITIFAAFTTFYVLVSVFVFAFSSIRNDSLKKRILKHSYQCLDERQNLLQDIQNELGISKHIPHWRNKTTIQYRKA